MCAPLFGCPRSKRKTLGVLIASASAWSESVLVISTASRGCSSPRGIRGIEPKRRRTRIDFGKLTTAEGRPLAERLRRELEREYQRLELVQSQLRIVEKERED